MSIINAVNFIIVINIRLYDVHESNRDFVDFIKYKQGSLTFFDSAFNCLFNVILFEYNKKKKLKTIEKIQKLGDVEII